MPQPHTDQTPWAGPIIVTGTDTGVGKTIATAAIAAAARAAGHRPAMIKPAQTGDDDDAGVVNRLAGCPARALTHYPDPLAPLAAARHIGAPPPRLQDVITAITDTAAHHDLVLIEGAGGVLVPIGEDGWTLADLAVALTAPAVVVARAALGTLNHTALTLEALHRRGVPTVVVIGAWPTHPELVHHTNLIDLPGTLAGTLPEGAGDLAPSVFQHHAPDWLTPTLYGRADSQALRAVAHVTTPAATQPRDF